MEDRHKRIVRASIMGIVVNLVLVVLKAAIGALSGSVSVIVDAVNSLTDILSATVTFVGIKLARRKPDREHPHGHGRVEYIAAIVVGLIILLAGMGAALASVPKISKPELASYSTISAVIIFAMVVVKFLFGRHLQKVGKATRSRSLEGTGIDAIFDAILTFGTLIGAVVSMVFGISFDGVIGLIISAFIVRSAMVIISKGVGDLIGRRADDRLTRKVRGIIKSVPEVEGIESLVLHDYGPEDVSGLAKIKINENIKVATLKKICEEIESKVFEETGVKLAVGV